MDSFYGGASECVKCSTDVGLNDSCLVIVTFVRLWAYNFCKTNNHIVENTGTFFQKQLFRARQPKPLRENPPIKRVNII